MSKKAGVIYDEMISNPRRLFITHVCLGLTVAFVYWMRPGTVPIRLRWSVPHFADVTPILLTSIAWVPYVISGLISRSLLSDRDPKATFAFIASAIIISAVSIAVYLDLIKFRAEPSAVLIGAGETLALIAAAYICHVLWPSDMAR